MTALTNEPIEPEHVAIRAGAGAGKTTRITRRYINHVLQHGLSPLQIVAVTFTDAAAMELRSRIREKLTEALGTDDDRLAELEAARICTFHALAAAICRQHPLEAGVPADFALLDEVQGALWAADHLDDALDSLPATLFSRVPFTGMRTILRRLMQDPIAAEEAFKADPEATTAAMEQARFRAIEQLITAPEFMDGVQFLKVHTGDGADLLEPMRQKMLEVAAQLEAGNTTDTAELVQQIKLTGGQQKNWIGVTPKEIRECIKLLRGSVSNALTQGVITLSQGPADLEMQDRLTDVQEAYTLVQQKLNEAKRRDRVLDFNDLEVHALQALESLHVRRFYHERWKAFVVDEYQDTNTVQDQILHRLRAPDARQAIVGDANQSIYGFRRADPTLIDTASKSIADKQGVLELLKTNYRTHGLLVEELNSLFVHMFAAATQSFTPQESKRSAPPSAQNGNWMRVIQIDAEKGTSNRQERAYHEARLIAAELKQLFESGMQINDRSTGDLRPLQWSDIAVISRTWDSLDFYETAFGEFGIPSVHMGGGNLINTREARDGCTLLRFLADPQDNLALAALLKSPFFSFSDTQLFNLRQGYRDISLWEALKISHDQSESAEKLQRWLNCRTSEAPSRLVHRADIECGYSAILRALPNGERRLADWRAFQDLVGSIEKTSFDAFSVSRVLRRLDMARADRTMRVDVPRPPLEAGNAISLMTIHRSKGLEWPVVIMADLGKQAQSDTSTLYCDPQLGIALKSTGKEKDEEQPALYLYLKYLQAQREAAEQRRLLYVAATRARDFLFMVAATENGASSSTSSWRVLEPSIQAIGKSVELHAHTSGGTGQRTMLPPNPLRPAPLQALGPIEATPTRLPATSLSTYRSCPKRFEFQFVLGHPGLGEGDDLYARRGTLVHKAIQFDIKTEAVLQRYDRSLAAETVKEALALANVYREDGFYARYRIAETVFEEPVTVEMGGITIVGRIDMLGPDFVLDFKTGQRKNEEEYLLQLWIYGVARQREELVICYFDSGKPTLRQRSEMHDAEETIQAITAGIRARNFKATPSARACEYCRYRALCPDKVAVESKERENSGT